MFEKLWPATEECLLREAGSFGEMLGRLRSRVSAALVGGRAWAAILDRARELPVTIAAFPFGFEVPLHETGASADFGVAVLGGSRTAASYQDSTARQRESDRTTRAVAQVLDEMEPEDAALCRVAGRKLLLEYDIAADGRGAQPDPGIFLYPDRGVLIGDRSPSRARGAQIVLKSLGAASGLGADSTELHYVRQVYMAMHPNTSLRAIGTFPGRGRGFRIAVTGFESAKEISGFLERAGWNGDSAGAASVLSRFEQIEGFGHAGVHLDVNSGGLGPDVGVSIYSGQGEWIRDVRQWMPFLDGLKEDPLVVPEKIRALADSSCGMETLYGSASPFMLLRGIHHLKFALRAGRTSRIKAYLFNLLIAPPGTGARD